VLVRDAWDLDKAEHKRWQQNGDNFGDDIYALYPSACKPTIDLPSSLKQGIGPEK
jgi:hypothetical protein